MIGSADLAKDQTFVLAYTQDFLYCHLEEDYVQEELYQDPFDYLMIHTHSYAERARKSILQGGLSALGVNPG